VIPLATTTVRIESLGGDPYETKTATTLASGVRAHLSSPSGIERLAGGSQEVLDKRLNCDPTTFDKDDRVTDEGTGVVYEVAWVDQRKGLGLDHTVAGLRKVTGSA
jgi:hypothetical protein